MERLLADGVKISQARLVAAALKGAWRVEPPAASLSESELKLVAPLLEGSGAGALAWWKFRQTPHSETDAARGFRESYRLQTLRAAVREGELESLFALLGAAGVDALLVKGWAAGRAYPEQGLRPSGDIDLYVRPSQHAAAREVLQSPEGRRFWVDLHEGSGELGGGDAEGLYARSRLLRLGGSRVRVPGEEDHLRLLCFHLLRHGAWRPLWLCDVAVAVESRGEGFDWGLLLDGDRRRANWVMSALGLAQSLLGADVEGTPAARAAEGLPRWLVPAVLERWARPYATEQAPLKHRAPMRAYLRRPRGLLGDLRRRWPGPVEATVAAGGRFDSLPRWPFQVANCFTRAAHFLAGTSNAAAD
ncbi:MAG TPA: nucleotidyltransferase family protein [Pyrinomonadaceae bacterium]